MELRSSMTDKKALNTDTWVYLILKHHLFFVHFLIPGATLFYFTPLKIILTDAKCKICGNQEAIKIWNKRYRYKKNTKTKKNIRNLNLDLTVANFKRTLHFYTCLLH